MNEGQSYLVNSDNFSSQEYNSYQGNQAHMSVTSPLTMESERRLSAIPDKLEFKWNLLRHFFPVGSNTNFQTENEIGF